MTIPQLILILILIESSNLPNPPDGDNGRAVGPLQIHKIMVDECNRIAGRKRWSYEDRSSRVKSIEMGSVFLVHQKRRLPGVSDQRLLESWNSGTIRRRANRNYQMKVKDRSKRLAFLSHRCSAPEVRATAKTVKAKLQEYKNEIRL